MMSSISRNNMDVMELTWENGQLALHEFELNPPPPPPLLPTKPPPAQSWGGGGEAGDHTLESIVHQATTTFNMYPQHQTMPSSSLRKWDPHMMSRQEEGNSSSGRSMHAADRPVAAVEKSASGKRVRSEFRGFEVEEMSASATFCRETDTTMMTWNSFESPRSLKSARINADDDSLYQDCSENRDGERVTKGESCRSQSSARRSRAAAIHNLSERRRRDRINEKMKALQNLVPNASKTDKASMLDEVIEYLKQLQAQIHMMSNARNNMPQMVMPNLGMQHQIQMSLLARMGMGMGMGMNMGMGMGMLDARNAPPSFPPLMHAAAQFVSPPPFAMVPPPTPSKPNVDAAAAVGSSMPNFNIDAYNTFLAQQSMNMEFMNKMSALYKQQISQQQSKKPVSLSLPNDAQGG